jgi:hypothetical protein
VATSAQNKSLLVALALSPLAVVPAWLTWGVWTYFFAPVRPSNWVNLFPLIVPVFGVPIAYVFTLLIGLPVFLILRRYGLHTLPILLTVAFAAVFSVLLAIGDGHVTMNAENVLYFYCAAWVASAAWTLAVWVPRLRSNRPLNGDAREAGAH